MKKQGQRELKDQSNSPNRKLPTQKLKSSFQLGRTEKTMKIKSTNEQP